MELNYRLFEEFREFDSERLKYCKFTKEYVEDMLRLRSDENAMRYVDRPLFTSLKETESFIDSFEQHYKEKAAITWAIISKENGKFVGYFSYWQIQHENCRGEAGYMILPEYWNRGYMTEALGKMLEVGFSRINFHSIVADVNPDNEASKRVLDKFGFKLEAHFRENYQFNGKFIDSLVYCLLKQDFNRD
jgi:[ribosomal protein S5]-alanine N-acetyltransferase